VKRNVIAYEIEKVISALTSQYFSRNEFLKKLDPFYAAIEMTADTISDFTQKQSFLNTVYEKFFQGFSVKIADTHGIVYTPQPIVKFMVKSVEHILQKEFGRSLSHEGVHIIDPFVGTGNFILWVMREIQHSKLPFKYNNELHCNEVMLLPYYIASMNIEHEYYEVTGRYEPFSGICLVDTFDINEKKKFSLFTKENTARVKRQQTSPIFVIIGNPPYNAGQVNENDNNKNRKYDAIEKRVSQTYGKSSKATLLRKLSDPYVKAIRWASDRIGDEGIVAFVTNNSFVEHITFDSMRGCLENEFDSIYILDFGGNSREGLKVSNSNVFGITVGVSINIFVKKSNTPSPKKASISYFPFDEYWNKQQKFDFLNNKESIVNIIFKDIYPDSQHNWLTVGIDKSFDSFIPIGTKEAKASHNIDAQTIFKTYSLGVNTARDSTVYNFNIQTLGKCVNQFVEDYNTEVYRFQQKGKPEDIDNFVNYDRIKWSSTLKNHLKYEHLMEFNKSEIRHSLYRPFIHTFLYYDSTIIDRPALFRRLFPDALSESHNQVMCIPGIGNRKRFGCLMSNTITSLDLSFEKTQCFPLYTYSEDVTNLQENITDWSLEQFQTHYSDISISKLNIFHYIYGILHHPQYCVKYSANLKRDLPHIPFAPDFWGFSKAGEKLAELHVNYEKQVEYPLKWIEDIDAKVNYRVDKMTLSKDKTQVLYNDFVTLGGIPPEVFEYRLGNRSALEWIIDQYRVKTDKRSGITNDPNNLDDPQYIIRLIGKVITVSLKTMKIVKALPALF
jgi:predicted helicase